MDRKSSPTRSVERALDILECFLDKDEMILLEISEKTGLSCSTVLRILSALQEYDFVSRNPQNKTYRLGNKIAWLADRIPRESYDELKKTAYPFMVELNEKYNEDVHLFISQGNTKLCIESVDSSRELRQIITVGSRHDIVRGAAGKIILAFMNENDRRKILNDADRKPEYEQILRQGYAISRGEREEGLFGLAVPVVDAQGKLLATVSISGPSVRFENSTLDEKIQDMCRIGQEISEAWSKRTR